MVARLRPLRLATRRSPLAIWQARYVGDKLGVPYELVEVSTAGDRDLSRPLASPGQPGLFVKEVQQAVVEGFADAAVHSAKDLPSKSHPDLRIAAVPVRHDPRDALVGRALEELGKGAVVATSAPRRRAQLAHLRPDLSFVALRGNLERRLSKVPELGAAVVAACALARLGLLERAAQVLPTELMLPQGGQGAIAVECRSGDLSTLELLSGIDDPQAHAELIAERSFLSALGASCDMPVGAYARVQSGMCRLEAVVASEDGRALLRRSAVGADPSEVGCRLAEELAGQATWL